MLLPAQAPLSSPVRRRDRAAWGRGERWASAIAVSAFGVLNGLILGTGELGYSMAPRGDLPRVIRTERSSAGTPVARSGVCGGHKLCILATAAVETPALRSSSCFRPLPCCRLFVRAAWVEAAIRLRAR